ncbi:MAG: DUF922 domain-containing protein [Salinimicrobium sediminis]|nr:DUF922 domain-containing protein [Salinimicrobium sediminis]
MKKAFFSTLLIFFLGFSANAQLPDNRISWTTDLLTWENFAGKPDPANPFHANTSSGISYSWSMKQTGVNIEFIYEVQSYFLPGESWVKPGRNSAHLLAHEQLHFDITELHARKLRKAMEEVDLKTPNLKPALQSIYKNVESSRADMQQQFDAETRHSMDAETQLKWQKYIKEELEKLSDFSS